MQSGVYRAVKSDGPDDLVFQSVKKRGAYAGLNWMQISGDGRSGLLPEESATRQVGRMHRPASISGFETDVIIYRNPKLLFAAKVLLRRLNTHMSEQELDLLQFTTGESHALT